MYAHRQIVNIYSNIEIYYGKLNGHYSLEFLSMLEGYLAKIFLQESYKYNVYEDAILFYSRNIEKGDGIQEFLTDELDCDLLIDCIISF